MTLADAAMLAFLERASRHYRVAARYRLKIERERPRRRG